MTQVKIRTKRQLEARRAARDAVASHRAAKSGGSPPIRPPTPEEIERFAVGGGGGDCGCAPTPPTTCTPTPCRPSSLNDCYHDIAQRYGCPLKVVSGGQVGVGPLERIAFRVEPSQSNYFLPIAVRLSARSRDDPNELLVWRLTAVMVKNHPQENYHDPNPGAGTVTGVESVAYDGVTAGEVPAFEVGWGPFSREALADHLELVGFNPYPADVVMNPRAELWGYPIDTLPAGWRCGEHPGRPTPPSVTGQPSSGNPRPSTPPVP